MPESRRLEQDAELLFDVVREAGALAQTMQRQEFRRWSKPDGTPVSEADEQVDALLRGKLQAARPAYGWLSEETPDNEQRLHCENLWIVDPIDGTRAFIRGGSEWCIAAALVSEGRPVAAAIYQPVPEDFYTAIAGKGAYKNGDAIRVDDRASLGGASVVGTVKSLAALLVHGIEADTSGSLPLQLRLVQVATGRFAGAVSFGAKNDWDLAAGDLLVHEAGGLATDLHGKAFIYNREQSWQHGMIAAGRKRQAKIISALGEA